MMLWLISGERHQQPPNYKHPTTNTQLQTPNYKGQNTKIMQLRNLVSFNQFNTKVQLMGLQGQPTADYKENWSYAELSDETERTAVQELYEFLGLTEKTKFAQVYCDRDGIFAKGQVWTPVIMRQTDGTLGLFVGFTVIPVIIADGAVYAVVGDQRKKLYVETSTYKSMLGKELKKATLIIPVCDADVTIEIPIALVDKDDDKLAKALSVLDGSKPFNIGLLSNVVVTKLKSNKDLIDINKLLQPVFSQGGDFEPIALEITGWSINQTTKWPKYHVSINVAPIVARYGDYMVQCFKEGETVPTINLSQVKKISISPTSLGASVLMGKTSERGVLMITGINSKTRNIEHAPDFEIYLESVLRSLDKAPAKLIGVLDSGHTPQLSPAANQVVTITAEDLGYIKEQNDHFQTVAAVAAVAAMQTTGATAEDLGLDMGEELYF